MPLLISHGWPGSVFALAPRGIHADAPFRKYGCVHAAMMSARRAQSSSENVNGRRKSNRVERIKSVFG
ncbi:MAG: hypothetical protein QF586_06345 [Arenicellales bacterium]|jgi:hypothetical protein|nr:hypothetical protein [Arenicellales bacterium]MDP6434517.1 hypothetical protein [Arenicellales bacterium]MDP6671921.1 hypothetical protein [Arenicellales bacterium]MDP6724697.1 hypothetical protein [Arenicellales bacterium]MDP7482389.1 hypothetical protein [Arenicellales bacterium]